jgi:hypothetical protein
MNRNAQVFLPWRQLNPHKAGFTAAAMDATAGDARLQVAQRDRCPGQQCSCEIRGAQLQPFQTDVGKTHALLPVGINLAGQAERVMAHPCMLATRTAMAITSSSRSMRSGASLTR